MSDAKRGAKRVGAVMTDLARRGYRCARISASGQRKGSRRSQDCIAGDALAFAPADSGLPHLAIEVGGVGKRLRSAFTELRAFLPPGFAPLVVRVVRRRKRWYTDEDSRFLHIDDALARFSRAAEGLHAEGLHDEIKTKRK